MKNINIPTKAQYAILILLLLITAFQQGNRIGYEQVKIWDEGSGARNAIEMMQNKNYLVVMHNGQPEELDVKPPFAVWLKVISYKVFGINEFSVRFPTLVSFWLIMLMFIFFSLQYLKVQYVAWISLILMASTPGFMGYHVARHGDPDTLLMFFVTGYMLTYFILLEKGKEAAIKYNVLLAIFIIGAAYTKSIAGLAPLAGIFVYTLISKKGWGLLKLPRTYITVVSALLVILCYYIVREAMYPGYLQNVLKFELGLFNDYPYTPKHPESSFYIKYLLYDAFRPYLYFTPLIIVPLLFSRNTFNKRLIIYSFIGALFFLLGHSSAVTKNEWYISPIYPFLWIMLSVAFYECLVLIGQIKLKKYWMVYIIQFVFVYAFTHKAVNNYRDIFNRNYMKPGRYIYEPERMGHYLCDLKERKPENKQLSCLTHYHTRQLEFYAKKYNYEDETEVLYFREPDSTMLGTKVFITDTISQKKLFEAFSTTRLDSAKYGRLYFIESRKEENDTIELNQ